MWRVYEGFCRGRKRRDRHEADTLTGEGRTRGGWDDEVKPQSGQTRHLGATPVLCDVYDLPTLKQIIQKAKPQIKINELTSLPDNPAQTEQYTPHNNTVRRIGTSNLLEAAKETPPKHFLTQSVAWEPRGDAGEAGLTNGKITLEAEGLIIR